MNFKLLFLMGMFWGNCYGVENFHNNKAIAFSYYTAMAEKNIDGVAKYLDEKVLFIAPLARVAGKQEFLARVEEFFACCSALTIHTVFSCDDQAMVVFSLDYPEPIGLVDAAALLYIEHGLIYKIQLFYDGRLFEKKT